MPNVNEPLTNLSRAPLFFVWSERVIFYNAHKIQKLSLYRVNRPYAYVYWFKLFDSYYRRASEQRYDELSMPDRLVSIEFHLT